MASVACIVEEVEEKLFEDSDSEDDLSELNSDFKFEDEQPYLHGSTTAVLDILVQEAQIDDVQSDEDIMMITKTRLYLLDAKKKN